MHSLYIGRVVYLAAPRSLHPFFLPSLITCLRVPLISVPGFGPEIPGAGAPLGHPGPEARTPNGWSSSVDQGGSNDHMIWVLQPLYGTRAQGSSSPVFFLRGGGKPCSQGIILSSSEREGEVVSPSPWTPLWPAVLPLLPSCWRHFLFPSIALHLCPASRPRSHVSCAVFHAPPHGQVQILKAQLRPHPSPLVKIA